MARAFLFAPVRRAVCAAAVALAVAGAADVVWASARSDYERLLARVEALRLDGPRPTPRPQLKRVAADAETIARRHAGSGYADNALWQAATVALASYRVYRQPADRTLGLQFLETLVRRYPSSSLVPEARALMRRHGPAPSAAKGLSAKATSAKASAAAKAAPSEARPTPPPLPVPVPMPVETAASGAMTPLTGPGRAPSPARLAEPVVATPVRATESTGRVATLRGLRRTTIGDTIRLTLDFDGEIAFDHQRLAGPDRVFFDFARTAAIPSLSDTVLQFEGPTVRRVRLGRPRPDVTRLAIDLDGVASYTVFALYHPFRLTIDLQPASPGRPGPWRRRRRPSGRPPRTRPSHERPRRCRVRGSCRRRSRCRRRCRPRRRLLRHCCAPPVSPHRPSSVPSRRPRGLSSSSRSSPSTTRRSRPGTRAAPSTRLRRWRRAGSRSRRRCCAPDARSR